MARKVVYERSGEPAQVVRVVENPGDLTEGRVISTPAIPGIRFDHVSISVADLDAQV
jgi:hypothetical protein